MGANTQGLYQLGGGGIGLMSNGVYRQITNPEDFLSHHGIDYGSLAPSSEMPAWQTSGGNESWQRLADRGYFNPSTGVSGATNEVITPEMNAQLEAAGIPPLQVGANYAQGTVAGMLGGTPPTTVGAPPATIQQYGEILTLPNGQRIHPDDPNYATYASQLGVQQGQPAPTQTLGVGSLISDPSQLTGLTEDDIARTTGDHIYRRDLAREQEMLGAYSQQYGAPQTPEDWLRFHDYVYMGIGTTGGAIPPETEDEGTITGGGMGDVGEIDFNEVADAPIINVAGLGANGQLDLTPTQQQAQNLSEDAQEATEELIGESAYQTEQEELYGVQGLTATITDLTAQLQQLQNEAASIRPALEEGAVGRGITTTILGRQERALLNQNAIQALSVSTLLAAAQGNLATAQNLADKAVAAKYDPIRERINVALANLELVQNSPQYSIEEQNQALAMKEILDAQKRALDNQEAEERAIKDLAITAIKNGADALTANAIMNAKTEMEAVQLAKDYLEKPKTGGGFTTTQRAKLEQAGLLNAPRQEQLNHLFGDGDADFDKAQQFIVDNPEASFDELKLALLDNTDLSATEINALLAGKKEEQRFTNEQIKSIAIAYVKSQGVEEAKNIINNGVINVNGKNIELSDAQIDSFVAKIDEEYPEGKRTWGQKIVPWGK